MSFLEQLKAQKGLGKKPPPKVVEPPKKKEPKIGKAPDPPLTATEVNKRLGKPKYRTDKSTGKIGPHEVLLERLGSEKPDVVIRTTALVEGTKVYCLDCGRLNTYPEDTRHGGRFCKQQLSPDCRVDKLSPNEVVGTYKTREEWLNKAIEKLNTELFVPYGNGIPIVRASVGFPSGSRPRKVQKTLGQYWPAAATTDGVPQIFISPSKNASGDIVTMLAVLVHEMVHAVSPTPGHGSDFKRIAKSVGLNGPMRSTTAGPALERKLKTVASALGTFPHGNIDPTTRKGKKGKLRGYECRECEFKLYTTQKWVDTCNGDLNCPAFPRCTGAMKFVPPKS